MNNTNIIAMDNRNTNNQTLTMSSREIAELLDVRHDNVKRTIERLADKDVITLPPLEETSFKDAAGRTQWTTEYRIGKRDSYVIVAQLSPEFTARLVDRWQELEEQVAQKPALPQTFAEALRLAAELEEQKETLRLQNEAMKPAAAVGMAVGQRERTTLGDFVRKLPGVNTMQVRNTLGLMKYIYKREGKWSVYAAYKGKYFAEAYDHQGFSVLAVLPKGQELLVDLYCKGHLPMLKGRTPNVGMISDLI